MSIDNQIFAQYRENKKEAMLNRLELHQSFKNGLHEIWIDPETMVKYKVQINRDFEKMEKINQEK
tara:strand:- start:782 stop:976 length:195 start_codon:yes stop_codon:yes gene_type:complete